jgi:type II secretory pathway pseudopilin PulG
MVVLAITGVLAAMAVPSYCRSVEQSRADMAAASLRSIWAAQRLYRMDHGHYAASIQELEAADLLDGGLDPDGDPATASAPFNYIVSVAGVDSFIAEAQRTGSNAWTGTLSIDAAGQISGVILRHGAPSLRPGYLFDQDEAGK